MKRAIIAAVAIALLGIAVFRSRPAREPFYVVRITSPDARTFEFSYAFVTPYLRDRKDHVTGPVEFTIRAEEVQLLVGNVTGAEKVEAALLRPESQRISGRFVTAASALISGGGTVLVYASNQRTGSTRL